mmetsp:Transcript_110044/g.173425  ORF Transcript_110044/g.173425 Transcript_110044/m.173425 type:complete len:86 (-) Transcript_110044:55-312(-)
MKTADFESACYACICHDACTYHSLRTQHVKKFHKKSWRNSIADRTEGSRTASSEYENLTFFTRCDLKNMLRSYWIPSPMPEARKL